MRILQLEQWQANLPLPDLLADPLAEEPGTKRAAVEQDRVDTRTTTQELGKVSGDRTIGRIGKPPLFQCSLRPVGIGLPIALGEEAIKQYRLKFSARQLRCTRSPDQAGTATGQGDRERFFGPAFGGKHLFLQIPAARDQIIPLRA